MNETALKGRPRGLDRMKRIEQHVEYLHIWLAENRPDISRLCVYPDDMKFIRRWRRAAVACGFVFVADDVLRQGLRIYTWERTDG